MIPLAGSDLWDILLDDEENDMCECKPMINLDGKVIGYRLCDTHARDAKEGRR